MSLNMWQHFAKVVGMTYGAFVELEEDQQKVAIESTDSEARYDIVVKIHQRWVQAEKP